MYPQAWIDYLVHFHGPRDYFECHEILEEYWKDKNQEEPIWVGLIQFAVSLYHYRRGNRIGAKRMMETAIINVEKHPLYGLGVDQHRLLQMMQDTVSRCDQGMPYEDVNLPLTSAALIEKCKQRCAVLNFVWCAPSPSHNLSIIHKHKTRDRSQIIKERMIRLKQNR